MAAAILAIACSQGFSQSMGGMSSPGGGRRSHSTEAQGSRHTDDAASNPAAVASKLREKLYELRLRLQLKPEQTVLWNNFYAKVWDWSVRLTLAHASTDGQSAVQTLSQRTTEAQDRALRFQEINDAVVKLYAALTPEQRDVADQDLPATVP